MSQSSNSTNDSSVVPILTTDCNNCNQENESGVNPYIDSSELNSSKTLF